MPPMSIYQLAAGSWAAGSNWKPSSMGPAALITLGLTVLLLVTCLANGSTVLDGGLMLDQSGPPMLPRYLPPWMALHGCLSPSRKNIYTLHLFGNSNRPVTCTFARLLVVPGTPSKTSFGCYTAIDEGPGPMFPEGVFMVSFALRRLLLTRSMNTLGGTISAPARP